MTDLYLFHQLFAVADELVVNIFVNKPSSCVAAHLASVKRDSANERLCGCFDIDVIKHNCGALAAQFQLHRNKVTTTRFTHNLSDFWRTGERHSLNLTVV